MKNKQVYSILLSLVVISMFLGCVTAMPHNDAYYSDVLTDRYPDSDFRRVDEAVLALDAGADTTVDQLVRTLDAIGTTDWEDVRAAFVWIAYNIELDAETFFSGMTPAQTAEETLAAGKAMSAGFADLFSAIVGEMGLENTVVSGYSKAFRFTPETDPKWSKHSWNIVVIDDEPRYFDPMWGTGNLEKRGFDQFYDEFYFDTDPTAFVFTNLPDRADQQGLTEPIDQQIFAKLPFLNGYSLGRGIEAEPFIDAVRNGHPVSTPQFYKYNHDLTYVELPMTSTLKSGENCRVVIESSSSEMMVLVGSGAQEAIKPVDGRFVYDKRVLSGSITFFLRNPWDDNLYWAICKYEVD